MHDGTILRAIPEELDAGLGIAGGGELEELDARLEDRVEGGLALGELLARLGQRLVPRGELGLDGGEPAPRRDQPRAEADGDEQAGREREPRRPPSASAAGPRQRPRLAFADPRQDPLAQRVTGRRFLAAQRQQSRHLAVLRHFALRLGGRREERLEPLRLVGRERTQRVGGGKVERRVVGRAGHVPRSK